jgi:hypothetical protein
VIKQRTMPPLTLDAGQGRFCYLDQPVGVAGFEPTTSSSRTKRATKLRHTPLEATTAYRTDPAIRQSGLRYPGLPGYRRGVGALQLTSGAVQGLHHSAAWNKRDVADLK